MSYPPPPGPDQNNPFQPPAGQQQYPGAPPQPDMSKQQPYPAYQQYPGGPAGMPFAGPPQSMPGTVKTARVLLFVFGSLSVIGSLFMFYIAGNADDPELIRDLGGKPEAGVFGALGVLVLAVAALAIISASMFGKGGSGVRVMAIITGSVYCLMGLGNLASGAPVGILTVAAGVLIIVFTANSNGSAWFKRPRV
jgi:hypothetical protein